jgi:thiamine kinase
MPRSDVERTALERVPGNGPVALEGLSSGLVNESYLAVRGGERYSLRVPVPGAAALGVDRAWECRVLAAAHCAGLAPRIECCEPRQGILVARWAQGRQWTIAEAALEENLTQMARLVRRVHGIPIPAAPRVMRPEDWMGYYRSALARHGTEPPPAVRAAAAQRLAALAALPPAPPVLCHGDLHVQNLVETERGLLLLDWEYAHVTEAGWDLAGWICSNDLSVNRARFLLAHYLGRQPGEADETRLRLLRWLYDCVCLLWIELYLKSSGGGDGGSLAARAAFLASRLRDS